MSVWEDLTICDFLDIIDSWKLVGWAKNGVQVTNLLDRIISVLGCLKPVQNSYFRSRPAIFQFSGTLIYLPISNTERNYSTCIYLYLSASGAQFHARPTGDQEVAGSTPAEVGNIFFFEIWSWNIFYDHSLPSTDSRKAVVSFWRKNVHNTG